MPVKPMSTFEVASRLAKQGFHVFPLVHDAKWPPIIKNFPERATTDPAQIEKWWLDPVLGIERGHNVGISTTRFNGTEFEIGVDVDCKDFDGYTEMLRLELEGFQLPPTYTQYTPSGGMHLVYRSKVQVGQRDLAPGINIRAKGGYVGGAGCTVGGKLYTANALPVAEAPEWLVARCSEAAERDPVQLPPDNVDENLARERAIQYLENIAHLSIQGASGDATAYAVAARVKDFGVDPFTTHELLLDHWNERCQPPWSADELWLKVERAFQYGKERPGAATPQADFQPIVEKAVDKAPDVLHPFEDLNSDHAFVISGGSHHIIWETKDADGGFELRHLKEDSFHKLFASWKMDVGNGQKPVTKLWIEHESRRTYEGFCFRPKLDTPKGFYNLFRGFSVDPLPKDKKASAKAQKALDDYLAHARENICRGVESHFQWLMGYFAHLFQKPWEKPHVAVVLQGKKGVGKNAFIDRIGHLLGPHYMETANKRHLTGDFNGHMENKLMLTLNEAFWSGDKQAEGILKHLITGSTHVIEHKGQESFTVENCSRVVIIGNEPWIVPAGPRERRYAIFDVGDCRQQDTKFFRLLQEGMNSGGYELLLRYFLDFDLTDFDCNTAPRTKALAEQIDLTLGDFERWWRSCLGEGRLVGSDIQGWPEDDVEKDKFRDALRRSANDDNIRSRMPSPEALGRALRRAAPSIDRTKKKRVGLQTFHVYRFPKLEIARKDWERHIGQSVDWDSDDLEEEAFT